MVVPCHFTILWPRVKNNRPLGTSYNMQKGFKTNLLLFLPTFGAHSMSANNFFFLKYICLGPIGYTVGNLTLTAGRNSLVDTSKFIAKWNGNGLTACLVTCLATYWQILRFSATLRILGNFWFFSILSIILDFFYIYQLSKKRSPITQLVYTLWGPHEVSGITWQVVACRKPLLSG